MSNPMIQIRVPPPAGVPRGAVPIGRAAAWLWLRVAGAAAVAGTLRARHQALHHREERCHA